MASEAAVMKRRRRRSAFHLTAPATSFLLYFTMFTGEELRSYWSTQNFLKSARDSKGSVTCLSSCRDGVRRPDEESIPSTMIHYRGLNQQLWRPTVTLHLPYIKPTSNLHLPFINHTLTLHPLYIYTTSNLYLPYICPKFTYIHPTSTRYLPYIYPISTYTHPTSAQVGVMQKIPVNV